MKVEIKEEGSKKDEKKVKKGHKKAQEQKLEN